ncbi:MAG: phosphoglycolate phosphatase [Myxococcales bacterium]
MPLRAIIYDLDGTLVDSRADIADAVNATLLRLRLPRRTDEEVASFVGDGAELLLARALGPAHAARLDEAMPVWRACYGEGLLAKTRLYDGIEAALALPPEARAVLTNKPGGFAREIVEGLGLGGKFRRVLGGDEAPRKPDPAALLSLCRELAAAPGETLFVGDSTIDLATGRAAGVPVCAVAWGFGRRPALEAAGPDYLCDAPAELAALLGRLAGSPRS